MNFNYSLKITGGSKGDIVFEKADINGNDAILGVDFKFNSDDETRDRDKNGRVELIVYGQINNTASASEVKKLGDWSKDKSNIYRDVILTIATDEGDTGENFTRKFHFDKMFCIDYTESYGITDEKTTSEENATFKLFMAQAPTYKHADADIDVG